MSSASVAHRPHATDTSQSGVGPPSGGNVDKGAIHKVTKALVARTPTILVRKKLPWLDRSRNGPDSAIPHVSDTVSCPSAQSNTVADAHTKTSTEPPNIGADALRSGTPQPFVYASSQYSSTPSDPDSLPAGLPKKDPASYERLVVAPNLPSRTQKSSRFVEHWLEDGVDTKRDPPDRSDDPSPKTVNLGTKSLNPAPGLDQKQRQVLQPSARLGHHRCESCEAALQPREMPDARGQRLQEVPTEPISVPLEPNPRRQTLQELPLHLIAPSSSSSQSNVSRHLSNLKRAIVKSQTSKSLDSTVSRLENLIKDAVGVANGAANVGHNAEVSRVLDNTSTTSRHATSVRAALEKPRPLSPPSSTPSSDSTRDELSRTASFRPTRGASRHTFTPANAKRGQFNIWSAGAQKLTRHDWSSTSKARSEGRSRRRSYYSETPSMTQTPPRLYQPDSADFIARDFAYNVPSRRLAALSEGSYGAAADFYGDYGQSVYYQPGVRPSIWGYDKTLPPLPEPAYDRHYSVSRKGTRVHRAHLLHGQKRRERALSEDRGVSPTQQVPVRPKRVQTGESLAVPASLQHKLNQEDQVRPSDSDRRKRASYVSHHHWHTPAFMQSAYYRETDVDDKKKESSGADSSEKPPLLSSHNWSLKHPRRAHLSIAEGQGFSLGRYHKRQPIAREWNMKRKRLTATIACLNTIFTGLIAGIYAGEVPRIQYQLGDTTHWVIFGNMLFFAGMGLTTLIFWPLPLLHGRRPYTLIAFGLMLPFHIPQALVVSLGQGPAAVYQVGLLLSRALTGLALGFANINLLPTLLDLFGASMMSEKPHQEVVAYDDVRRQGGGIGVWLGIWTFCFSSSLSIGFCIGACIISTLNASWGFWIIIMLLAFFLLVNVIAPETRKSAYRRSVHHFYDHTEPRKVRRRVARGEVKLHITNEGPRYWWEEVWAGIVLTTRMVLQPGFFVLMLYLGWIYAQLTLVILLLGALLSREYRWASYYVGLAALAVPIGAALAMPLTKASWLSRSRVTPPRTDSMTMRQPRFTWSSHFVRRVLFSVLLPFAGLAYCLTSPGPSLSWVACVIFAGFMGFLTDLAIAECIGLIMETFDTCDLQPGVNTKHRLQSLSSISKRRRTNYSSFPRVCAAFFAAQSLGFFLAAGATVVSGRLTNTYGAQMSMYIFAAILLGMTLLFFVIITRWKEVQVVPERKEGVDPEWKPVVIGKPSGKMRRINCLEMGRWSRWSEIRRLNGLV